MKAYFIKLALRDVSPMVWRRLQISGNTSLAKLHHIIQIVYNWDDEYLHQFHIYGKDYGLSYVGDILFSEDCHYVYLDDFEFDESDKFTYEYNFFEHNLVDIRIESIKNASAQAPVYCMKGNGMPGANKYDTIEATLNLFEALANADESTTVGDLRPFVDALNAVRFNLPSINSTLRKELTRLS